MIAFVTAYLIAGTIIGMGMFFVNLWQLEGMAALWDAAIAATSFTILLIVGRVWGPALQPTDAEPLGEWIVASLADTPGTMILGGTLLSATLWTGWSIAQQ